MSAVDELLRDPADTHLGQLMQAALRRYKAHGLTADVRLELEQLADEWLVTDFEHQAARLMRELTGPRRPTPADPFRDNAALHGHDYGRRVLWPVALVAAAAFLLWLWW